MLAKRLTTIVTLNFSRLCGFSHDIIFKEKELKYLLKKNHFDSKIKLDKLICIITVLQWSLLQIINTKMHQKLLVQVG